MASPDSGDCASLYLAVMLIPTWADGVALTIDGDAGGGGGGVVLDGLPSPCPQW